MKVCDCNLKAFAFVISWVEFKLITDILTSCHNLDYLYAIFYWLYWCTCHTKETSHLTRMGIIFSMNSYRCFSLLYFGNSTLFLKLFFSLILLYSFIYLSIKKKELSQLSWYSSEKLFLKAILEYCFFRFLKTKHYTFRQALLAVFTLISINIIIQKKY